MQILYAITVLCVVVLLWAGLAIRRHIAASARQRAERQQRPPATAVIEVELKHELRTAKAEKGFFGSISDPQPGRHTISRTRQAVRESAIREAVTAVPIFAVPPVFAAPPIFAATPMAEPVQQAEAPQPEAAVESHETSAPLEFRKPPIAIHNSGFERLDMAHFNKDLGDLSDPYQIPRTASRNRS
jgi:hypothetical protein